LLKEIRVRELRADRLEFATAKAVFFHMSMANVDAVIRCNWEKDGSRDPSCLSRFAAILNRSGISEETSDFNARYRLIDHVLSGYMAAALMATASKLSGHLIRTPRDLTQWIKSHDWTQLVNTVVTYYFALGRVAFQRGEAIDRSTQEYEARRANIMSKRKGQRTERENRFCSETGRKSFLDMRTMALRDKVLENTVLFMNQALIAVDFHQSMRKGEVGRLEANLKIMMINFHGCGKTKYARVLLERQFDQHHVWTPEHHYVDIRNNLMNLSGRRDSFLGVDENLELVNADLQSGYNPRDTWQSLEWHREVVSPNIIPFRRMRESVLKSSGVTTGGKKHTRPDNKGDILRVMEILLKEDVLSPQKGRVAVGPSGARLPIREAVDMFDKGSDVLLHGGVVKALVEGRRCQPIAPDMPELSAAEWADELDEAIEMWNASTRELTQMGIERKGVEMEVD
jgi:IS1 family transposase